MHKLRNKVAAAILAASAGLPVFAQEGGNSWDFAQAKTAVSGMGQGVSDLFLGSGGVLDQYKTVLIAIGTLIVVGIVFAWVISAARRKR